MKSKKHIYGNPTDKHVQAMQHTPATIVDVDLSHHLSANYPEHGSDDHKEELMRVKRAYENPANSKEYQDVVDHSVKAPFKAFCKENNILYPKALMKALNRDTKYYVLTLKFHFNRPRPYQDAEVFGIPYAKGASFSSGSPAYPSGHSTQARMFATVLGRLFPAHKHDFEVIADSIDRTRLDLGVHYPSDIEAGKKLGKHLGLVCDLTNPVRLAESSLTDPAEANIKTRVGLKIQLPPELSVTDAIDSIKAIRDVSTARQFGSQEVSNATGRTTINLYVTIVGGKLSPEGLLKKINMLDDIISAYIKNVDGERYYQAPRRERKMRKPTVERLVHELVGELIAEATEMNDELYSAITDGHGKFKEKGLSSKLQYKKMAQYSKWHYESELSGVYKFFPTALNGNTIKRPTGEPALDALVAELKSNSIQEPQEVADFVKSKGGTAEHSFYCAFAVSPSSTAGNDWEAAIAGYVNFKSPGSANASASGKAGEDLEIEGVVCEVKSSQTDSFTSALNASSFAPDPNKAYLYLTNTAKIDGRKKLPTDAVRIFVVSSDLLHKAFTYEATKQSGSDGSSLDKVIDDGLNDVLGPISLKDFVTGVVVSGKPQDMTKSFNIPGTSLSVRIRINFTANKLGRIQDSFNVEVLNSGILLSEELTKTDKKEIERIAKKTVKKEIDVALRDFKKSELEKEITKVLGSKATKEEVSKISKAVIKRLYRELSINYPAIIDRIKV